MTNREKLLEARRLIIEVRETLDPTTSECPHCKRTSKTSWEDAKANETLKGMTDRLETIAAYSADVAPWIMRTEADRIKHRVHDFTGRSPLPAERVARTETKQSNPNGGTNDE